MKAKILSVLLILAALLSALASCGPAGEGGGSLTLFKSGRTEFTILRPDKGEEYVLSAAAELFTKLKPYAPDPEDCFSVKSDWAKSEEDIPKNEKVILVGATNRPDTAKAFEGLGYDSYRVTVINGRIYVAGYTEEALLAAVRRLVLSIREMTEDAECKIDSDFLLEGSLGTALDSLPPVPGSTSHSVTDMGDGCMLVVTKNASDASFVGYKELLKTKYSLYAETKLGDNLFSTFEDGKSVVNTYYMPSLSEIRTTIEPLEATALPDRQEDNSYDTVTTPLLTQIGVEDPTQSRDDTQNGMSYVFRLSDGRFIIYDGGFGYSEKDAGNMKKVLKEQATDPDKIVIAAWIITHAHGDHNSAFHYFVHNYIYNKASTEFTVERVIRNTPTDEQCEGASGSVSTAGKQRTAEEILKKTGTKLIKSHPGQVFHIADAKITVLYNLEMFMPRRFTYFNTSSTITRLELGGESFAMLGDSSEDASRILTSVYTGDVLACSFVQVAHHGYAGGTSELYRAIDPTYVLWPMGGNHFETYKDNPRSEFLVTGSKKVEAIFLAENVRYTFGLPFDGKNFTKTEQ